MNTHWPMVVNNKCQYAGGALPRNRATVTAQSKCGLDAVIRLIDLMKSLDIYDESLIIIMGDHGAYIPPYRYRPEPIIKNGNAYKVEPWLVAQVTPLMLIKVPESNHIPLEMSDAPSSIVDTAKTINSILKFNDVYDGQSMLELHSSDIRERKHYFYEWSREDWGSDYTGAIQEFIVNGSVYDASAWQLGRVYMPPDN